MGFGNLGIALGSATDAYNEADKEAYRRKMLDAAQAQSDQRFAREQQGWNQEDKINDGLAQGTKDAQAALDAKGNKEEVTGDTLKRKLGLNLSDEAYSGIADAIKGGADGGAIMRAYQADPNYASAPTAPAAPMAPITSMPAPEKPPSFAAPATGIPMAPTSEAPMATGMDTPPAATGMPTGQPAPAPMPAGMSPEAWSNFRTHTGADGKSYMTTTEQRAPKNSEILAMTGTHLMGQGNMKALQAGLALHKQGMEEHQIEAKQDLDNIINGGGSVADKLAQMAKLVGGSSIVPGTAQIVNHNGTPSLQYIVPGQKEPMYMPLKGDNPMDMLSNARFKIESMFDAKLHHDNRTLDQKDVELGNNIKATDASVTHLGQQTEALKAALPYVAGEAKAGIYAKNAQGNYANSAASANNYGLKRTKEQDSAVDAARENINTFYDKPEKDRKPGEEAELLRKNGLSIANTAPEIQKYIASFSKSNPDMTKAEEDQLKIYQAHLTEAQKQGKFEPSKGVTASQRIQDAKAEGAAVAGLVPGDRMYARLVGGSSSMPGNPAALAASMGAPAPASPAPTPANGLNVHAPIARSFDVDLRNDPTISTLQNALSGLDKNDAANTQKIMAYGTAINNRKQQLQEQYGRMTKLNFD